LLLLKPLKWGALATLPAFFFHRRHRPMPGIEVKPHESIADYELANWLPCPIGEPHWRIDRRTVMTVVPAIVEAELKRRRVAEYFTENAETVCTHGALHLEQRANCTSSRFSRWQLLRSHLRIT
jgi:hypothetical protein